MMPDAQAVKGPLWAQPEEDADEGLSLWKALAIAFALEVLAPILVLGVDWSFLHLPEPPVTPVMNVRLDPPPEPLPPPQPKRKLEPEKKLEQIEVDLPQMPETAQPKIRLAKPEPKPKPKRREEPLPEPEPAPEEQAEPEPEAPPLPSVFQDIKPVRKVKPNYPPEAEAQHIQGHVRVRLSVNTDGDVADVQILQAEPQGVFEEAVLEAVRQYKFKRDGTSYQADQDVIFRID
jgi:protein TonB